MNSRQLTKELVTRDNRYSFHRFIGMMPNPDKVMSASGRGIEAYRDLKNDPHVWSCIQSRKSGVLSLESRIEKQNSSDNAFRAIVDVFKELDTHTLKNDILEAVLFGWQPFEIMWRIENNGLALPFAVTAKPHEWFFYNEKGELRYNSSSVGESFPAPPEKIIAARHASSYSNPYGEALLAKCYWHCTFKNGGIRFWVNYIEKFGMPVMIGRYNRGSTQEETDQLASALARMTEDAVIVAPNDIEIELKESAKMSSSELYKDLVEYCNAEISKAVLSQTLTTEMKLGSYAAAKTHFEVRQEVIRTDIRIVEAFINKIIKLVMKINFNSEPAPVFRLVQPLKRTRQDDDSTGTFEIIED